MEVVDEEGVADLSVKSTEATGDTDSPGTLLENVSKEEGETAEIADTLEPTLEPSVESTVLPTVESDAEPAVEPSVELTAESSIEPAIEPTIEPSIEPANEPTIESTIESTIEPTIESTIEPTVESTVESTVEPTAEPAIEPESEPTTSLVEPDAVDMEAIVDEVKVDDDKDAKKLPEPEPQDAAEAELEFEPEEDEQMLDLSVKKDFNDEKDEEKDDKLKLAEEEKLEADKENEMEEGEEEEDTANDMTLDLSTTASKSPQEEATSTVQDEPMALTVENKVPVVTNGISTSAEDELMDVDEMPDAAKEEKKPVAVIANGFAKHTVDEDSEEESEEEFAMPPSPKLKELTREELVQRERKIQQFKEALRNEEMKLVLLKKLRQSQMMKENIVVPSPPTGPSSVGSGGHSGHGAHSTHGAHGAHGTQGAHGAPTNLSSHAPVHHSKQPLHQPPPPSHHNRGQVPSPAPPPSHQRGSSGSSRNHSVLNPPAAHHRGHQAMHGPPMGLNSHRSANNHGVNMHGAHQSGNRAGALSSMGRTPVTTPPNVVMGFPVQELRASHVNQVTSSNSPAPIVEPTQTPAQRQAAAKLALRKQLEKTLLQIPPPKPPPPEMHFIPNANNTEFIYYLGLESCVDILTENPNVIKPPPEPFECVQCGTDFTPVWKWQDRIDPKRGRPAVICEACVTSNIKKALKAEHTNRLKTAFVKALQQEQEIEQRIASGAVSPPLPTVSPPTAYTNHAVHVREPTNQYNNVREALALSREREQQERDRERERDHGHQRERERENNNNNRGHQRERDHERHRERQRERDRDRERDGESNQSSLLRQAPPAHSAGSSYSSSRNSANAAAAAAAAAAVANSAALLQQMPKLSPAHQSLLQAQAQQLQQLAQGAQQQGLPQPAHLNPFAPLLYQYAQHGMLGKPGGMSASDLQVHRQYLLDMIPSASRGGQSSGHNNWK